MNGEVKLALGSSIVARDLYKNYGKQPYKYYNENSSTKKARLPVFRSLSFKNLTRFYGWLNNENKVILDDLIRLRFVNLFIEKKTPTRLRGSFSN